MDSVIVFVAKYFIVLSVLIVAWFWLRSNKSTQIKLAVRLVIGGVLALVIAYIAARVYYDPRPFVTEHIKPLFAHAPDNGFPSDHVLFISLLGFTVLAYSRKVGALLLAVALAVGGARMAAHIHSLQDIVGSFAISALAAAVATWITRIRRFRRIWRIWRH